MPIDHINLARVDLNLLVALDALLAERSVTKAAARIGIGQSAMSHNLARLRDLFDDELLTRGPKGMQPTPRALALADPVRIALAQIETLVSRDETFNPATAERVFRIGLPDSVEVLVGPALLTYVCAHAPGIRFRFYAAEGQGLLDHLDADRLDLGIGVGAFAGGQAHHKRRVLATDSYLVMFNAQKIDIETPISLEDYVRVPHVLTSLRLGERGVVDEVLEQMGLKRHVALVTPRFVAVPFLVAGSPVLTTMHARLAIYFADQLGLSLSPPPIELPKLTTSLLWHASYDRDPAHVWLRETIMRVSVEERAKLRAAGRLDI
ncbi:transcriptional regulator, LysR family [Hyphomicrobium sulfonivorans]|uniref:Transcriptional regulator, LysR family n=1 Tax=Hyphomicrobium sulfonivorans TaxID=121290 RepID=A0A120CXI4_HYPSL|nr:LysR family transcriptional regulator [Hyphomicrobium sulfonivorans]KWT70995.1 transcriptional regulator, LysR family [Hyphomicrobium sulfonivorans]